MKIEVTQDDIKNGVPGAAFKCPVARAASRAFGCDVGVGSSLTVYDKSCGETKITDYELPPIADKFVADYDSGREVAPIIFNLVRINLIRKDICKPF